MEDDRHNSCHELDGSRLEGGGQILRNSVAYSALLRTGIRIVNIRAGRDPPGLRMQHLTGIQAVQKLCNADLRGAEVSSTTLSFLPGELRPSGLDLVVDIQTAGSITLVLQILLPVLLFQPSTSSSSSGSENSSNTSKPSRITLVGGTNATNAPQIDFFIHVFLPVVERMFGKDRVRARVLQRGYYPKGGGRVLLEVTPIPPGENLKAIDSTEVGILSRIRGYIFVGGSLPQHIAWDMHKQVVQDLQLAERVGRQRFPQLVSDLRVVVEEATGGGSGMVIWAETDTGCVLPGTALGERRKKPKGVAKEATEMLLENLSREVCVDEFLQDQLIIFMALAKGRSRFLSGPLSLHTQTAMWLATELAGVTFDVAELDDQRFLVQCDGIGFSSPLQTLPASDI